jgi:nucleotide-binding universal stress UspA family protein
MVFKKVLVPVDMTEKNKRAVDVARDLAEQYKGEVHLLHVIEELKLPVDEVQELYEELGRSAAEKLNELARPLREAGVTVREEVVYGNRAREIVDIADAGAFDVIVLSSHKTNLENPAENWATLSHKVAILSQTPVLLVK